MVVMSQFSPAKFIDISKMRDMMGAEAKVETSRWYVSKLGLSRKPEMEHMINLLSSRVAIG